MRFFVTVALLLSCQVGLANNSSFFPFPNFFGEFLGGKGKKTGEITARLRVPESYDANKKYPLVVMLHGCLQSGADMGELTGMDELASARGFFVLYPEQSSARNLNRCWNWFRPEDQSRSGEPQRIIEHVDHVQKQYNIDRRRIYVAGFSAGASLASVMANCYPEKFAGVAIHSGTSYMSASNLGQAFTAMRSGSQIRLKVAAKRGFVCSGRKVQKPVPFFVIHGHKDFVVNSVNQHQVVKQMQMFNDYLDDGRENDSYTLKEPEVTRGTITGGYVYELSVFKKQKAAYLSVQDLRHAWSGGKRTSYGDPKGPSATSMIVKFFGL